MPPADDENADDGSACTPPAGQATTGRAALSAHTRDRIATQLRAMYDTVAQAPVPDRFAELIARLDGGADKR